VLLLGARWRDDERLEVEADAVIVTHALKARTLFGTWYHENGRRERIRVRWTPNRDYGMTEEPSVLEIA
jgi:hypothetical protein